MNYFEVSRIKPLSQVKPASKIHVIGVCGVAMAPLAIQLQQLGYKVSGSDKEFYEPMGGLLKKSAVALNNGYNETNLSSDLALVIIGNTVSRDNVEVQAVEKLGLAYSCFPQLLYDLGISGRHSIVVAGTHGKTTTTALCAHTLEQLEAKPSFFVGGIPLDFGIGLRISAGSYAVVEGDEYDSAFFAKVPKFSFYKPKTCIITSIEYDHADIYPNLDAIKNEFTKLVLSMPQDGLVVCCNDDAVIKELLPTWRKQAKAKFLSYGQSLSSDFCLVSNSSVDGKQRVKVKSNTFGEFEYTLALIGTHNVSNSLAILAALTECGFDRVKIAQAFSSFHGTKRRQEIRFNKNGITLIDDFAHHPTAVNVTLAAVKAAYPGRRVVAVFEPRSNTSRRKVFQRDYINAFSHAAQVILSDVPKRASDAGLDLLDVSTLAKGISDAGVPAKCLKDADAIATSLLIDTKPGDVILVMSNGGFGGLVEKLCVGLEKR